MKYFSITISFAKIFFYNRMILLSPSCGIITDVPIFYPLFLKMLNEFYIKWQTGCNTNILWGNFLYSVRGWTV
jgi:hypothetical protein